MKIRFLGAAGQVTGSRYVLEAGGLRVMVDCGLFQERAYLGRNWEASPVRPAEIDFVLLTHAHLDHTGLLPRLVREGFSGPILATAATTELASIILEDSGHIHEEDAAYKKKRHKKERREPERPVEPLYTQADAAATMPLFRDVKYGEAVSLNENVSVTWRDAGHILGSAMLDVRVRGEGGADRTILFSGDIGQWDKPIIRDPSMFERADYVIMESTYGNRNHSDNGDIEDQLARIINTAVDAGGNVVIPTFAVERAQELIYHVGRLVRADRIPPLLVFLDSPMAVDVTEVFRRHRDLMDADAKRMLEAGEPVLRFEGLSLVRSVMESKAINRIRGSCIILSASGMCTGGRIKHHLVNNLEQPESTIVFVGYQATGTLGRQLVSGKKRVRIHGAQRTVKARIEQVHGLSAHADQSGLLKWLGHLKDAPRRVFLTHGEEDAAGELAEQIRARWHWPVEVPGYQDEFELV